MSDTNMTDINLKEQNDEQDIDYTGKVGLVLSGGGGKGAYQVGVLKALKENNLLDNVVAISGASIGAVNSMLYAMDDIDGMYKAWDEIDMDMVFDIDLEQLLANKPFFSRDEMLEMMEKYIDFNKIKNGNYDIYTSICRVDASDMKLGAEYRKLSDYETDTIKQILLASTALPLVYEAVEIDGNYYRDGGICDNEPVKPLYDAGIRDFIVIGLKHGKVFNEAKWPGANFVTIYPSHDLGDLLQGTLDFSEKSIDFRQLLGYKDGLRAIKTKFQKDEIYIRMENALAQNDYNEVKMQLKADTAFKSVEKKINKHMDYFNNLAKKYE